MSLVMETVRFCLVGQSVGGENLIYIFLPNQLLTKIGVSMVTSHFCQRRIQISWKTAGASSRIYKGGVKDEFCIERGIYVFRASSGTLGNG